MKYFLILFCLIVLTNFECEALHKELSQPQDSVSQRKYFIVISIGFAEYTSFCFGYQINSNYSLCMKAQEIFLESRSGGGATGFVASGAYGIGLVGSHYFNGAIFNSVKLSAVSLFGSSNHNEPNEFIKGVSLELTFNRENIISNSFKFYYELGGVLITYKGKNNFLSPSVKIGMLYNL